MKLTFLYIIPALLISFFLLGVAFPIIAQPFGGISTLVAFLTVLLTYFYVVLTAMMVNRLAKSQEEERRPFITVDLEFDQHEVHLVIQNLGKTPAIRLKIEFSPDIVNSIGKTLSKTIFYNPIPTFPPGKISRSFVDFSPDLLAAGIPEQYKITATYSFPWADTPVKEEHTFDVGLEKQRLFVANKP